MRGALVLNDNNDLHEDNDNNLKSGTMSDGLVADTAMGHPSEAS